MNELADIFHDYGPAYCQKYGERMLPSHQRAMRAIRRCRTEAMGGHVYYCDDCEATHYCYHSCKNRHCPKCQYDKGQVWLAKQEDLLLPTSYFMLTFTLPSALRSLARSHQKLLYNLLFRTSAAATQQLAGDPRFLGGQIGMIGVLHTWGRDLIYHPHVHYLVPGGGLAADGQSWLSARNDFLVHVKPLSILFRAKFRAELQKAGLLAQVPPSVWHQDWVVHCQSVGNGRAALKYLAPYIFRVAISNNRILKVANDRVTFRYQDTETGQTRYCTLAAEEFIRRFLQHVLPKGFVKVRYYGFFSPGKRRQLPAVRQLVPASFPVGQSDKPEQTQRPSLSGRCPQCGQQMRLLYTLKPKRYRPP